MSPDIFIARCPQRINQEQVKSVVREKDGRRYKDINKIVR
jgi:hypothetical protein